MESREIGELVQTYSEFEFEWNIKDFFPINKEVHIYFKSPKFYFSGSSWEIWLYSNRVTKDASDESVHLYLAKMSEGSPVSVIYSLGIKSLDGESDLVFKRSSDFVEKDSGKGCKLVLISELSKRKTEFTLSNNLTVFCTMKNSKRLSATGSLFSRYQDLSDNLEDIYYEGKWADCTLKVGSQAILAHRMLLEKRSSVFADMFNHDTNENQTGEISIDGIEKHAMEAIVVYMYSGDMKRLTTENVFSIYAAADKYDIKDIKKICSEFITRNLSTGWVCDVIKFCVLYQEEEVSRSVKGYIKQNAREILKTEKWKIFARENNESPIELLGSVLGDVISN